MNLDDQLKPHLVAKGYPGFLNCIMVTPFPQNAFTHGNLNQDLIWSNLLDLLHRACRFKTSFSSLQISIGSNNSLRLSRVDLALQLNSLRSEYDYSVLLILSCVH